MLRQQALWWAQDYAWAGAVWASTLFAPPSPDHYAAGKGRTVLAIPGVYENWQFMRPLIVPLALRGHAVHVAVDLGLNRAPITDGAHLVLSLLAERDLRDVVIVAHSKGGLIGKLAMLADDGRIASMVTVCTPFHGSSRVHLLPLRSVRPLAPKHPSLVGLGEASAVNARITSIYSSFDEQVPEGSILPGARNIRLDVPGHFKVVAHPSCLAAVLAVVEHAG